MRLYSKRLLLIAFGIISGLTASAQIIALCNYFKAYEDGSFLAQAGPEWSAFPGVDRTRADGRIDMASGANLVIGPRTDSTSTDLVYSTPEGGEPIFQFVPIVETNAIMTLAFSTEETLGEKEAYIFSVGSADLVNHLIQDSTQGYLYRLTDTGVDTLISFDPSVDFYDITLRYRDTGTQIVVSGAGGRIAEFLAPEQLDRINFYSAGPAGVYEIAEICPPGTVGTNSAFEARPLTTQTFRTGQDVPARYQRSDLRLYATNGRRVAAAMQLIDLPVGLYYAIFREGEVLTRERWVVLP